MTDTKYCFPKKMTDLKTRGHIQNWSLDWIWITNWKYLAKYEDFAIRFEIKYFFFNSLQVKRDTYSKN